MTEINLADSTINPRSTEKQPEHLSEDALIALYQEINDTRRSHSPMDTGLRRVDIFDPKTCIRLADDLQDRHYGGVVTHTITPFDEQGRTGIPSVVQEQPGGALVTMDKDGTVESHNPDGSTTLIGTNNHGWHLSTTIDSNNTDKTQRYLETEISDRGDIFNRHGKTDILDQIVSGKCVPEARRGEAPAPCTEIEGTIALLKTPNEPAELLVLPTQGDPNGHGNVSGIEDPQLLVPGAPNYVAMALKPEITGKVNDLMIAHLMQQKGETHQQAERELAGRVIGITVNSAGPQQDRLHIHVDYFDPEIITSLQDKLSKMDGTFKDVGFETRGRKYKAMWVDADAAGHFPESVNPFKLIHDSQSNIDMAVQAFGVLPQVRNGHHGFVILLGQFDPTIQYSGSAEELQHGDAWAKSGPIL